MEWHNLEEEKPTEFGNYLFKVKHNGEEGYIVDMWVEGEGYWIRHPEDEVTAWSKI